MYLSKCWNINKSKHCRWEEAGLAREQPGVGRSGLARLGVILIEWAHCLFTDDGGAFFLVRHRGS